MRPIPQPMSSTRSSGLRPPSSLKKEAYSAPTLSKSPWRRKGSPRGGVLAPRIRLTRSEGAQSSRLASAFARYMAFALAKRAAVLLLVVLAVLAGADRAPPLLVVAVPLHGPLQPLGEVDLRLPAELVAELLGGERVAAVVARAVGDVLDQRLVGAGQLDHPPDDLDVLALVGAADVVGLAGPAVHQHRVDPAAEVLDEEPVADLPPVPVHRQRGSMHRVQDHQRNQLLWILPRAVVVGAAHDRGLDAVGVDVGGDEQVAGRLGRRVGRGGVEGRGLGEGAGVNRAVDLVGGDLQGAR